MLPRPSAARTLAVLAPAFALALALWLPPRPAAGGDLEVSPILIELSGTSRTALVSLRNAGGTAMRYQARVYAWAQGTDGLMDLTPAKDLVVFPPLLELQAGEARNLRVGADAAPGAAERAWRLVIEELPRKDLAPGTQVQVLTRLGVPVFFAPKRPSQKAELALLSRDGARIRFTLRNTGTTRLRPAAVTLALRAAGGATVHEQGLEPWYVLAGGERIYEVQVPAAACVKAAELVLTAALEAGAVEARLPGACREP